MTVSRRPSRIVDDIRIEAIDFSSVDVVIAVTPDGRRCVVKGRGLVAATRRGAAPPGQETARLMTVECATWPEVRELLAHLGV